MVSVLGIGARSGRGRSDPADAAWPARPDGAVVWAHATDPVRLSAVLGIVQRLKSSNPMTGAVVTYRPDTLPSQPSAPGRESADALVALGEDGAAAGRRFAQHWRPDICLWTGGAFAHHHIGAVDALGAHMVLADFGTADLPRAGRRWLPDPARRRFELFDTILTNSGVAAQALYRLGIAPGRVSVAARLHRSANPPPCSMDDFDDAMQEIGGRPVWLAAEVRPEEVDAVLSAHLAALRLAHRLLLVLVAASPQAEAEAVRILSTRGLRFCRWDEGGTIEDNIQVALSAETETLGLWYRVAPLSFLANSLTPAGTGISPLEAAALGSAVLYGPNVGAHIETYSRLAAAGAARAVNDAGSLGAALVQLVAPDHAAAMALAGWEVATEGAGATDLIVEVVMDALDRRKAADARP